MHTWTQFHQNSVVHCALCGTHFGVLDGAEEGFPARQMGFQSSAVDAGHSIITKCLASTAEDWSPIWRAGKPSLAPVIVLSTSFYYECFFAMNRHINNCMCVAVIASH